MGTHYSRRPNSMFLNTPYMNSGEMLKPFIEMDHFLLGTHNINPHPL